MLARKDRNEMRAAYQLRFRTKPEVEFEGSDHMLGVLKRILLRGEFPSWTSTRLWLYTPSRGNLNTRGGNPKRTRIIEESYGASSEKQWKRMLLEQSRDLPRLGGVLVGHGLRGRLHAPPAQSGGPEDGGHLPPVSFPGEMSHLLA